MPTLQRPEIRIIFEIAQTKIILVHLKEKQSQNRKIVLLLLRWLPT